MSLYTTQIELNVKQLQEMCVWILALSFRYITSHNHMLYRFLQCKQITMLSTRQLSCIRVNYDRHQSHPQTLDHCCFKEVLYLIIVRGGQIRVCQGSQYAMDWVNYDSFTNDFSITRPAVLAAS